MSLEVSAISSYFQPLRSAKATASSLVSNDSCSAVIRSVQFHIHTYIHTYLQYINTYIYKTHKSIVIYRDKHTYIHTCIHSKQICTFNTFHSSIGTYIHTYIHMHATREENSKDEQYVEW